MSLNETAIKVENISKLYRIGLKEQMHDSFGGALLDFIKSPLANYRKYRSLYKFGDVDADSNSGPSDTIWALRDISFEVKRGEAIGIIGRNGAGKSTLLKILSKITDPTGGRAECRGRISSLLEVGTGFHQELSGRENVYLNGAILGMKKREIDRKFDEIVEFSGVEKFLDTPVKRYSSGMRIRLAFSVAAYLEPEILIVDEVLAVGDANFQRKCLDKMENVGRQGRTVLFVSHNMSAISRLCNRGILLDEGRIIAQGSTRRVLSEYLTSDSGTMAVREWPDPNKAPTNGVALLRAVRAKTESDQVTDTFDIRRPIKIEMEYDILKPDLVLMVHFSLATEGNECAFTTIDQDPAWRRRPRPTGHYVSTTCIPGNLLAEGMVSVSCYILTLNPDRIEIAERGVIAFRVIDSIEGDSARGDYTKDIPGVVRPLLNWETQYTV